MQTIICYDVSDAKCRQRLVKYLMGFAYRLQYSVFQCDIRSSEREKIQSRMAEIVKKDKTATITVFPLCNDCMGKTWSLGSPKEDYPYDAVII